MEGVQWARSQESVNRKRLRQNKVWVPVDSSMRTGTCLQAQAVKFTYGGRKCGTGV